MQLLLSLCFSRVVLVDLVVKTERGARAKKTCQHNETVAQAREEHDFFVSSALVDIICRRSQITVRRTKAK